MAIFNKSVAGDPTAPLCILEHLGRSVVYLKDWIYHDNLRLAACTHGCILSLYTMMLTNL